MIRVKKALVTTGLLWVTIFSFAQSSDFLVLTNEGTIGKIVATQEEIKAKEYIFPERIYDSYIDTVSHTITLQLRKQNNNGKWKNKGKIIFFDINNEIVKWSKKISYQKNTIKQTGSTIIFTEESKSYCLNTENGKSLWEINSYIDIIDPIVHFGIGYKIEPIKSYSNTITLEWFDLTNGKMMWWKTYKKEYGVNDIFRLKDSVWMIVADGLYSLNAHNGDFWGYPVVTGKKKYDRVVAANVAGVALGLLSGTYIITTGHDLVRDIVSNVLYLDSSEIYFASKELISRIDNGAIIWSRPLPEDLTSKSVLFAKDNLVYMINYGSATMGYSRINFGTPFFAAFNKETGEQIFLHTFDFKNNPIRHSKIEEDHIFLVFKDKVVLCSLFNGRPILEKSISNNEFGELIGFTGNHVYIDDANSFMKNLSLSDVSKNYIITNKDKILIFDTELNVVGDFNTNQMYRAYAYLKEDYKLVKKVKDNQTIVLDADNKKLAEMGIIPQSILIGNKLYGIRGNRVFEIDVTNLIE